MTAPGADGETAAVASELLAVQVDPAADMP
jgi:hypothetical protein